MTTNTPLPPVPGPATRPPLVNAGQEPVGSLHDYYYELAQQALNEVDPVPPAPRSSACVSAEAQDTNQEPAGSPYLRNWSMDVTPTYKLTDAELFDKGRWQLEALRKREVLKRAMEVPTIYPEVK